MKMSLKDVQRNDFFSKVQQPTVVYHMTDRKNVPSILHDRRIRVFGDFLCFFFPDLDSIPIYLDLSNAYEGRVYFGNDGMYHTAPPIIPEDTVVFKLEPRYKEPFAWFKENTAKEVPLGTEKQIHELFDQCRLCHYGDMKFKNPEILELTDILSSHPWQRPSGW